jgi:hypothetical protein
MADVLELTSTVTSWGTALNEQDWRQRSFVDEKSEADCCRGTISLHQRKIALVPNGEIALVTTQRYIDGDTEAQRKLVSLI